MRIENMNEGDCLSFLQSHRLARLACAFDNKPYLVPIHYAFRNHYFYSFSMPGKKIDIMRKNPHASVLIDEFGSDRGWKSVIAEGRFEELPDRIGSKIERDQAWSLLSKHANWWEPGSLKPDRSAPSGDPAHIFYRIAVDAISGREAKA